MLEQLVNCFLKAVFVHIFKSFFDVLKNNQTRSDTQPPHLCAGGQGPYLRSLYHLDRSGRAKDRKNVNTNSSLVALVLASRPKS